MLCEYYFSQFWIWSRRQQRMHTPSQVLTHAHIDIKVGITLLTLMMPSALVLRLQ